MEFLTTKGIAASIEKIIRKAKDFIIIISPYVKIDKVYIERLYEAEQNNVKISLIFGKNDMQALEKEKFQIFRNLNIYFLDNLHAKCYMNENTALIASMNLYGYSEENNREMGVEVGKSENIKLYDDIKKESDSIIDSSQKYDLGNKKSPLSFLKQIITSSENLSASNKNRKNDNLKKKNNKYDRESNFGYCIRCREKIELNINRPLCNNCYQSWARYENINYTETYCHKCGREVDSFFEDTRIDYAHPLCYDCWNESNFSDYPDLSDTPF